MRRVEQLGTLLNGVAANAAEASRTVEIDCGNADFVGYVAQFTHNAATASLLSWYGSVDGGTTYGLIQSQSVSAGVATQSNYQHSDAVSGDEDYADQIGVAAYTHVKAIWSATGGGASDSIILQCSKAYNTR